MTFGAFRNQILGAGGTLIRELMKSINYVQGVSGWQITREGDAEFNNLVARGTILVTDSSGSHVFIYGNSQEAKIDFQPPDSTNPLVGFDPGSIGTESNGAGASLVIRSPSTYTPDVSDPATIRMTNGSPTYSSIEFDAALLYAGPLLIPMGFGRINGVFSQFDSAAIGVTDTVVLTAPSQNYGPSRAYRIVHHNRYIVSAATASIPYVGFRKTNTAGQLLGDPGRFSLPASTSTFGHGSSSVFIVGPTAVTCTIVMYLSIPGGVLTIVQKGAVDNPRTFDIYDIGPSNDYAAAPVLV